MQEYYWIFLLFVLIIALGLGLIFYIKFKGPKINPGDERFLTDMWKNVLAEQYSNPNKAILDADKILDKTMQALGYKGNVGEKLKAARSVFSDLNGVWRAHKLRNKLAHELGVELNANEIKDALLQYKKALRDLGLKL